MKAEAPSINPVALETRPFDVSRDSIVVGFIPLGTMVEVSFTDIRGLDGTSVVQHEVPVKSFSVVDSVDEAPPTQNGMSGGNNANSLGGEASGESDKTPEEIAAELGIDRLLEGNLFYHIAGDPRYGPAFIDGLVPEGAAPLTVVDDNPLVLLVAGKFKDRKDARELRHQMYAIADDPDIQPAGGNVNVTVGEFYADYLKHIWPPEAERPRYEHEHIVAVWRMAGSGDILMTLHINGQISDDEFAMYERNLNPPKGVDVEERARTGAQQTGDQGLVIEDEEGRVAAHGEVPVNSLGTGGRGSSINVLDSKQRVIIRNPSNYVPGGMPTIGIRMKNEESL